MPTITTSDGVEIFYKDWGSGQPIVFSHGWPLTADDWDAQMMFFLHQGYRVIAHDRRGHGRSDQVGTESNPGGQPQEWFDAVRAGVLGNRSEFYRAVPEGPFYGFNRSGVEPSEAVIANWWRQGMSGSAHAHYETVSSWLEDYTEDLRTITVPVLVMHGDDDQIVPFTSAVPRAVDVLQNGVLNTYAGYPHGMPTTHADVLNPDLLAFIAS